MGAIDYVSSVKMASKNYTTFTLTFSSSETLGLQVQKLSMTEMAKNTIAKSLKTHVVVTQIFQGQQCDRVGGVKINDLVTHIENTKFKGDIDAFVSLIGRQRKKKSNNTYTVTFARVNSTNVKSKKSTKKLSTKTKARRRTPSKGRTAAASSPGSGSSPKKSASSQAKTKKTPKKRASSKGRGKYSTSQPKNNTRVVNEEEHLAHFSRHGTRVPAQGEQDTTRLHNDIPLFVALTTYLGYVVLTVFGRLRDFFGRSRIHPLV